ncbi:MAG: type II toxin-antitoxin system mRNA interferase toxin, RelE/StbE family [Patescibacteria group bacterium]
MPQVYYLKSFKKQFKRLPPKIQDKFGEKLEIFMTDCSAPILNDHTLSGQWINHRSINITGDYRAIYKLEKVIAIFVVIGNHDELYGK